MSTVFARYLDDFLASADATGGQVELPDHPQSVIQLSDVERALNNPRVLFSSTDQSESRECLRLLFTFALWLRHSPPTSVPASLTSRAARLRFGVWSLPVRMDWPQEWRSLKVGWSWRPLTRNDVVVEPRPPLALSPEMILAEARAAREDWLAHLNAWEDDPWLAARYLRRPSSLEADLRWLTLTWPRPPHGKPAWPDRPACLTLEPTGSKDRSAYHRVATDLAEMHWLPRGTLRSAAVALLPDQDGARLLPSLYRLLPWLYPLAALGVVGLFVRAHVLVAACDALGLRVVGGGVAALAPSGLSGLALLRIPAAAAVGLVVLISLTSRWWLAPRGWTVGAGLLVIAALYLVLESRLHGAQRLWAYPRGLIIAAIGALHAFVISLAVLAFVVPVVADHGGCLEGWWLLNPWSARTLIGDCARDLGPQAAAPAGVLLLMTGWSLAVGLAAQILWDDRPVTAPLGRLRRVRGATP